MTDRTTWQGPVQQRRRRRWPAVLGSTLLAIVLGVLLLSDPPLWWHRIELMWNSLVPHRTADPSLRPLDSAFLVVPAGGSKHEELRVVDTKTRVVERQLTSGGIGAGAPTLSPDRRTVYYTDRSGFVHSVNVDGSAESIIIRTTKDCPYVRHVAMSRADPTHLLLQCRDRLMSGQTNYNDTFVLTDLTGLAVRSFDTTSTKLDDPTLSPDGRFLAYWGSSDSDTKGYQGGSLFILQTDGLHEPEKITDDENALDADPAWAPDSRTLAFRRRTTDGQDTVYTISRSGTNLKKVLKNAEKPSWSPDGDELAVVRRESKTELSVIRVSRSGGKSTRLIGPFNSVFAPVWSSR